MVECKRINTIGISKFLNIATGNRNIRYNAAVGIQSMVDFFGRDDLEIHLLGCDEGPSIVRRIHSAVPAVRGCDSAFAYIAAQAGQVIDASTMRPKGGIDFLYGGEPDDLRSRLYEMEAAAGAIYNTSSEHWRDK